MEGGAAYLGGTKKIYEDILIPMLCLPESVSGVIRFTNILAYNKKPCKKKNTTFSGVSVGVNAKLCVVKKN